MASVAISADLCEVALHKNHNWAGHKACDAPPRGTKFTAPQPIQAQRHLFVDSGFKEERHIVNGANLRTRFDVICRFCLDENECLLDIFGSNACVVATTESLIDVKIEADDLLPKQICTNCYQLLNQCLAFKQLVTSTDTVLRRCIDQLKQIEIQNQKDGGAASAPGITEQHIFDAISTTNQLRDGQKFEDLIEEDYTPDYEMVYETDPNLYSDYDETAVPGEDDAIIYSPEVTSEPITRPNDAVESPPNVKRKIRKSVICGQCDKEFSCNSILQRHKKSHATKKLKYQCSVCNKRFSRQAGLKCHMSSHESPNEDAENETNSFKCAKCNTSFSVERDLYIHGSIHPEDDKIRCRKCGKDFPNLTKLRRHVKTHYEDKPIKCEQCGRGFPELASLTRHYRIHTNEPRDRKHVCKECGKAYFDSHALSVHYRTHTGERPWVCTKCDKRFIDSRLLNSHMRTHTNVRNFSCSVCQKSFAHRSTLTSHMRLHTGEKPFVCNVCGKCFIQRSNLMLHLRVHSGEKPYKCSHCSKTFGSSSALTMHVRTHTGEKPYSCKLCSKRFSRHNLKAHMRTHTGEKPYQCTECSRNFTTAGQLTQHKKRHSSEVRFACEICNKIWTTFKSLKKHMSAHLIGSETATNNAVPLETTVLEKNHPYDQHRIRIEEIQSDAEFNEHAMLVNDLLASVVNVSADVLQSGNMEIPELSSYDSNQDMGELRNEMNATSFGNGETKNKRNCTGRVFVTEA